VQSVPPAFYALPGNEWGFYGMEHVSYWPSIMGIASFHMVGKIKILLAAKNVQEKSYESM
jgi:hypothetical protein